MRPTSTVITRRVIVAGTSLVVAGAAVIGGVGALGGVADAATPVGTPSATPSASASAPAKHGASAEVRADVRAIVHSLPASLRTDLRAAEHHPKAADRKAALEKVEAKALAGGYGATAETIVKDLKADTGSSSGKLGAREHRLGGGHRGSRAREARGLLRRALEGRYGTTLQHQLESLASSLPAVPAKSSSGS
jgi:hypothetical protein